MISDALDLNNVALVTAGVHTPHSLLQTHVSMLHCTLHSGALTTSESEVTVQPAIFDIGSRGGYSINDQFIPLLSERPL